MLAKLLCLATFLVRAGEPVGPLMFTDQYEHTWQLSEMRGSVVVLIAGDRVGNKYNGTWERAVRARYQRQVKIVPVANLASVPGFMHGFVRGKFISKDPAHPNGSVLLDWKGTVAKTFGFHDDLANVYVIDQEGVFRYAGSGQGRGAELEPLFQVVDGLLTH